MVGQNLRDQIDREKAGESRESWVIEILKERERRWEEGRAREGGRYDKDIKKFRERESRRRTAHMVRETT